MSPTPAESSALLVQPSTYIQALCYCALRGQSIPHPVLLLLDGQDELLRDMGTFLLNRWDLWKRYHIVFLHTGMTTIAQPTPSVKLAHCLTENWITGFLSVWKYLDSVLIAVGGDQEHLASHPL
jgi:hypothetical protein